MRAGIAQVRPDVDVGALPRDPAHHESTTIHAPHYAAEQREATMHVFIDESGSFSGFESNNPGSLSAVGALSIPDSGLPKLLAKYQKLRQRLPKEDGEVKGRGLSENDIADVVEVLRRNGAILEVSVTDVGAHSKAGIAKYRDELADYMEAKKPKFNAEAQKDVASAVRQIRLTSPQLFLQSIVTMDVLQRVIEYIPLYFVQRQPKELGSFKWIVDSKDRNKTTDWEKWWSTYCQGVLAARSIRRPGAEIAGADYSYFRNSYGTIYYGEEVTDLKLLFSDFFFSAESEFGLELVDIVTNAARRALTGNLTKLGWEGLPGLMIHRNGPYIGFMNLEGAAAIAQAPPYESVVRHFTNGGKNMLSPNTLRLAKEEKERM